MELSDRLKSLGVRIGRQDLATDQNQKQNSGWINEFPIEAVVSGRYKETEFGPIYISTQTFDPNHQHGNIPINISSEHWILAAWAKANRLPHLNKQKIAFIDTETSGLAGGAGTYAFLVGVGCFTHDSFLVEQYFMRSPVEEPALLSALLERLAAFEAVVTFNGKSFDLPLLNTRFTLNSLPNPFGAMDHIDLLHLARRLWRERLPSRALSTLEQDILGFRRDLEEVPGYLIPQYYFDYLSNHDARPLSGVFYHNVYDIVSLAALFDYTSCILEYPNLAGLHSIDLVAVARLHEENGRIESAAELYEHALEQGLPELVFFSTIERFASLRRKQKRYDLAVSLWERSARNGDLNAYKEISKLLEHSLRAPDEALNWVNRALDLIETLSLPKYQVQFWREEFHKRRERLVKKNRYA